jgi:hypothetical protein
MRRCKNSIEPSRAPPPPKTSRSEEGARPLRRKLGPKADSKGFFPIGDAKLMKLAQQGDPEISPRFAILQTRTIWLIAAGWSQPALA